MERRFSIKRAFLDLLYIKSQLIELFKNDLKYQEILNYMNSTNFLESDEPIPSLKQIGKDLNLKPYNLSKLIELYEDVFDFESNLFLRFHKTEIYFDLRYFENDRGVVKCNRIPYLPRVGENIEIPFLKAQVGTSYFYVNEISHELSSKVQRIFIQLRSGFYNRYFDYVKQKALHKGVISLDDAFNKHDIQIKDEINEN